MINEFSFPVPGIIFGRSCNDIYEKIKDERGKISFDNKLETIKGADVFSSTILDGVLNLHGLRIARLADFGNAAILKAVESGRHYIVAPQLVLCGCEIKYAPNAQIAKQIYTQIEKKNGRLEFPCIIDGFDFYPEGNNSYGFDFVTRESFNFRVDDRFHSKWNGMKFDHTDIHGMPLHLDKEKGQRSWYTRGNGLSKVHMHARDIHVDSGILDYSLPNGRMIAVRA